MALPEDPDNEDFAALFAESEQDSDAAAGRDVDLGGKSEGMLEIVELLDKDGNLTVSVGDTIEARVVDAGERSGVVVLGQSLGKGAAGQSELQLAYEHEIPVEGVVTAVNKGGFDVQVAGVRAFCPVSQIDSRFVDTPEEFIGQHHHFRITRYDPGNRGNANIVLSRRALLEEETATRAADTRSRMEVGAVFHGAVTRIEDYGAFVDIGGIEGMLHIGQLGFSRVEHPSEVVQVGQELEVQVVKIEKTDNPRRPEKVGLSLKSLARDPWDDVKSQLSVGAQVKGTVSRIEQFGAFVEVAPGIEGLVHISEMGAGERISSPRKVVSTGQAVEVKVLSIDTERRRISLSIDAATRDAEAAGEREAMASYGSSKESLGSLGDLLKDAIDKK
jgi:small subunit ribosomal protein S1